MSKSKSRQPSRQAAAANRSGSNGAARAATTASKPAAKVAVEDAPESAEQETLAATVAVEEEETSLEEAPEEKETSTATSLKATASPTVAKISAEDASEKKESASAKAAKAVPSASKAAPAKVSAKAVPNTPPLRSIPNTPAGVGSKQSHDAAKYERRQAERQMRYLAERRQRRNRIVTVISVILVVAILGGGGFWLFRQYSSGAFQTKPVAQGTYQEPIFNTSYPPVDSVYCDQLEGSVEHIHAYVAIYINGQPSAVPQYVGIPQDSSGNSTCFYWLHTHDSSGIIHIESPVNEIFTFGQFRDEWDQQFQSLGFAPELLLNAGWTIWLNGQKYNGTLSNVPLAAHNIVTLAYNSPNVKPVKTYNWGSL